MKNIWIIAKKDLGSFFSSPVFYSLTSVFLILNGFIFFNILNFFSLQSFQAQQMRGGGIGLNLNEMVIEPSFHNMAVILLLIIPLVTMRSFAEEKKSKTFALLLSSPIHLREIIIGKSLADKMDFSIGDSISIYSTKLNMSYLAMPLTKELLVTNIFKNRILRSDEFLIFTVSKEYSFPNKKFTDIEIVGDIDGVVTMPNDNIVSWKDRNRQLFDATEIEKKITFFTLFLIIVVASFNLSSSVMQIATKKTREMAILSTFGMSKNSISSIFLVYGYLLAITAIVSGILFALLIAFLQFELFKILLSLTVTFSKICGI